MVFMTMHAMKKNARFEGKFGTLITRTRSGRVRWQEITLNRRRACGGAGLVTFTAADDDDHSPCTQFTQRSRPHHQLSAVKERKADGGLSEKGKFQVP